MGNSLLGSCDRRMNRDAVLEWHPDSENKRKEEEETEDTVARPLRAPYTPAEMKCGNPLFVHRPFPQTNESFISLRTTTYNLSPQTNRERNRFLQRTSLFGSSDKNNTGLTPVSITTTRHLDPVRVGAGIVLTKVVEVLEEYPRKPRQNMNSLLPRESSAQSWSRERIPVTPSQSPDFMSETFIIPPRNVETQLQELPVNKESESDVRVPPNSASNLGVRLFAART